jgi:hypothetical protein
VFLVDRSSFEPRTKNAERRTKNEERRTKNAERRTKNEERRTVNPEQLTLASLVRYDFQTTRGAQSFGGHSAIRVFQALGELK